jgi:DNA-binding NtrC family response regulator
MTDPPGLHPQPSRASNSGGLSRVFVVDDESVIASTLASILELNGYVVRHFVDPLEALDVPAEEGPELLISDVVMPKLSGVDLAIRMKEKCPTCKVLLFSGQAETADLLQTARQRGHQFSLLQKPVQPAKLLARINELAVAQ